MDEFGLAIDEGEDGPECLASALVKGRRAATSDSKDSLRQKHGRPSSNYIVIQGMMENLGAGHSEVDALKCKDL